MWRCEKCGRIFEKKGQMHSCQKVPLDSHFVNKPQAKALFDFLVEQIETKIDKCKFISLPCCVHLFGKYDFLAALPKKDRLEIRFALNRKLDTPRLKQAVPLSSTNFKNCFDISNTSEVDEEMMKWLTEAYQLKN